MSKLTRLIEQMDGLEARIEDLERRRTRSGVLGRLYHLFADRFWPEAEPTRQVAPKRARGASTVDHDDTPTAEDTLVTRSPRAHWNVRGAVLYRSIGEAFRALHGHDNMRVHLETDSGEHLGVVSFSTVPTYGHLIAYIKEHWWDGRATTLRWCVLVRGHVVLGGDFLTLAPDPEVQARRLHERMLSDPLPEGVDLPAPRVTPRAAVPDAPGSKPNKTQRRGPTPEQLAALARGRAPTRTDAPVKQPNKTEKPKRIPTPEQAAALERGRRELTQNKALKESPKLVRAQQHALVDLWFAAQPLVGRGERATPLRSLIKLGLAEGDAARCWINAEGKKLASVLFPVNRTWVRPISEHGMDVLAALAERCLRAGALSRDQAERVAELHKYELVEWNLGWLRLTPLGRFRMLAQRDSEAKAGKR